MVYHIIDIRGGEWIGNILLVNLAYRARPGCIGILNVFLVFVSCLYLNPKSSNTRGWHCIVTCTSTHDHGQDIDPSNFHAWPLTAPKIWPWPLTIQHYPCPSIAMESLWPFLSCPWFLPWPLDRFQNSTLTAWPHGRGWESSCLCIVTPLVIPLGASGWCIGRIFRGYIYIHFFPCKVWLF